ncbi:MAG: ATP-binding protein [Anaerolineaceae bacterium]|jgi:signal transduction histidine kinase/DNA-binding response OmpR family regulator|nr:ATP-binding protein [Anaerolineaceae bacterium]
MDKILLVENDPVISDLIVRQALQAANFETVVVGEASAAITRVMQQAPDVIIADLSLPGLSTQDMIIALASQNIHTPVIALARQGDDTRITQAFRLGASDLLIWPFNETEVLAVVARALKQTHASQEREMLARRLKETNVELQQRVRELTTIYNIGKAVTSITDQSLLFEKILDGATRVTHSDLGWFLLGEDGGNKFRLTAQRNLPDALAQHINQPWDDGISSLVSMSGETLTIHGGPLKRFKVASLGESAMVTPIKAQKQVIGLLVVMRKKSEPFMESEQHLLEALADYASISLINARLFQAVEKRAQTLQRAANSAQIGEKITNEMLEVVKTTLRGHLNETYRSLEKLAKTPLARWHANQRQELANVEEQLKKLNQITEAIQPLPITNPAQVRAQTNLNDLVIKSVNYFQHFAQQNHVSLVVETPEKPIAVRADSLQISQVMNGLLSNAIKYSRPGGQVTVQVERAGNGQAQVSIRDTGTGIYEKQLAAIFEPKDDDKPKTLRFGGLGVHLPLIEELIIGNQGKIWAESRPEQGTTFTFVLPIA